MLHREEGVLVFQLRAVASSNPDDRVVQSVQVGPGAPPSPRLPPRRPSPSPSPAPAPQPCPGVPPAHAGCMPD